MEGIVPQLSIIFMAVSCAAAFVIPSVLAIRLRKIKGVSIRSFLTGCIIMTLFAFTLESMVHRMILGSAAGTAILGNAWLYALYGGIMAGLFEETGRYIAFRYVLRDCASNDWNAVMYGAGHGGFEAMALLGISMINNIIISLNINSGSSAMTEGLSGDALAQAESVIRSLIDTPSYMFIAGTAERIFAIVLHISLSVIVWFSVNGGHKKSLFLMAVLIHAGVDAVTALMSGMGTSVLLIEIAVALMSAAAAFYALKIWRRDVIE